MARAVWVWAGLLWPLWLDLISWLGAATCLDRDIWAELGCFAGLSGLSCIGLDWAVRLDWAV